MRQQGPGIRGSLHGLLEDSSIARLTSYTVTPSRCDERRDSNLDDRHKRWKTRVIVARAHGKNLGICFNIVYRVIVRIYERAPVCVFRV